MTKTNLEKILTAFSGKRTEFKLYNAIFFSHVVVYDNYTWKIEKNILKINEDNILIGDIISLDLLITDSERIAMIKETDDLFCAYYIAKGHLVSGVIESLDEKKPQHTLQEQLDWLKEIIEKQLSFKASYLSSNEVLENLVLNYQIDIKSDTALSKSALKAIISEIEDVIAKLERIDIF